MKIRRILSLLIAMLMIVSTLPMGVFAETGTALDNQDAVNNAVEKYYNLTKLTTAVLSDGVTYYYSENGDLAGLRTNLEDEELTAFVAAGCTAYTVDEDGKVTGLCNNHNKETFEVDNYIYSLTQTYTLNAIVATDDTKYNVGDYVAKSEVTVKAIYKTDEAEDFEDLDQENQDNAITNQLDGYYTTGVTDFTLENYKVTGEASEDGKKGQLVTVKYGDCSYDMEIVIDVFDIKNPQTTSTPVGEAVNDTKHYPTSGDAAIFNAEAYYQDGDEEGNPTGTPTTAIVRQPYDNDGHNITELTKWDDKSFRNWAGTWWNYWAGTPAYKVTYEPYNTFTVKNDTGENITSNGFTIAPGGSMQYEAGKKTVLTPNSNPCTFSSGRLYTDYFKENFQNGVVGKDMFEEAGKYTVEVVVPYTYWYRTWCPNHGYSCPWASYTAYDWYRYYSFNIVIKQASLNIEDPAEVAYGYDDQKKEEAVASEQAAVTKVQNHSWSTSITGENKEQVGIEYIYSAVSNKTYSSETTPYSKGENWGNDEHVQVDKATYTVKGISWEANVLAPKDQNNYLCQFDGDVRSTEPAGDGEYQGHVVDKNGIATSITGDGQNSYYSGADASLTFAGNQKTTTGAIDGGFDVLFTFEKDQKVNALNTKGEASSTNKTNTLFGKTTAADTVGTTGWEFEKKEFKNSNPTDEKIIDGVFGEDFQIDFKLNLADTGLQQKYHVKRGEPVYTASTKVDDSRLIDDIEAKAENVFSLLEDASYPDGCDTEEKQTAYLNKKDYKNGQYTAKTYDGDYWTIKIYYKNNAGEKVDIVEPYAGHLSDKDDALALHTWKSDALRACEFYGADKYYIDIAYNGLFFSKETKQEYINNNKWDGDEEFVWVYVDDTYEFTISQRELAYKPLKDLHKIYDGTNLLVRQTVDASTGYVTKVSGYYIDMNTTYGDDQFQKHPDKAFYNWITPTLNGTGDDKKTNATDWLAELTTTVGSNDPVVEKLEKYNEETKKTEVTYYMGIKTDSPTGRTNMSVDLWLAGYYTKEDNDNFAEDANTGKGVILTKIVLADSHSEVANSTDNTGDYKNFVLVDKNEPVEEGSYSKGIITSGTPTADQPNDTASSGTVSTAQMTVKHNVDATIPVKSTSVSMRDAVGLDIQAQKLYVNGIHNREFDYKNDSPNEWLITNANSGASFEMNTVQLIEKDYKNDNEDRYDYDDFYLLVLNKNSVNIVEHAEIDKDIIDTQKHYAASGLAINSDDGTIRSVALNSKGETNVEEMPEVRVDVRDYSNYIPILDSQELGNVGTATTDRFYNTCERYTTNGSDYDLYLEAVENDAAYNAGKNVSKYAPYYVGYLTEKEEIAHKQGDREKWGFSDVYAGSGVVTKADGKNDGNGPRLVDDGYNTVVSDTRKTEVEGRTEVEIRRGQEFISHSIRYTIVGNQNTYKLHLPVDQLNNRESGTDKYDSKFINQTDGSVTPSGTSEKYEWLTLYAGNAEGAEFEFTIPQNSYLANVYIVTVKDRTIPEFETLKAFADGGANENLAVECKYTVEKDGAAQIGVTQNGLKLTLKNIVPAKNFEGENIVTTSLPSGNEQLGGATYTFRLDTENRSVGNEYPLVIVPVYKEYGELIHREIVDGERLPDIGFAVNEETGEITVNYNLNYDTSEYKEADVNEKWGLLELSYSDITLAAAKGKLDAGTKDGGGIKTLNVTDDETFFNPATLLPGTEITVTVNVWRNGVVSTLDKTANEISDKDSFDTASVTHILTIDEYLALFRNKLITFYGAVSENEDDILGIGYYDGETYKLDKGVDFSKIPVMIVRNDEVSANLGLWKVVQNVNLYDVAQSWVKGYWDAGTFKTTETIELADDDKIGETITSAPATLYADSWIIKLDVEGGDHGTIKVDGVEYSTDSNIYVANNTERVSFTVGADDGYKVSATLGGVAIASSTEITKADTGKTLLVTYTKKSGGGSSSGSSSGGGGGGSSSSDYTVKFETNGGSTIASKSVAKNEKLKAPTAPKKTGYIFEGWYTDKGLTTAYDFDAKVTKSFTLYAKWSEDSGSGVDQWLETGSHIAYMQGCVGGVFKPNAGMTRAEAAVMIYNLLRDDVEIGTAKAYNDVKAKSWYADAVNALRYLGIMQGDKNNNFMPQKQITREEFAAIVTRFAKPKTTDEMKFTDVKENRWSYESISTAAAYGWIEGDGKGSFRPTGDILRVEAATIMNRVLGRTPDKEYIDANVDKLVKFGDVDKKYWGYYTIYEACNEHDYKIENNEEIWTE